MRGRPHNDVVGLLAGAGAAVGGAARANLVLCNPAPDEADRSDPEPPDWKRHAVAATHSHKASPAAGKRPRMPLSERFLLPASCTRSLCHESESETRLPWTRQTHRISTALGDGQTCCRVAIRQEKSDECCKAPLSRLRSHPTSRVLGLHLSASASHRCGGQDL